jgi:hypothetical protein
MESVRMKEYLKNITVLYASVLLLLLFIRSSYAGALEIIPEQQAYNVGQEVSLVVSPAAAYQKYKFFVKYQGNEWNVISDWGDKGTTTFRFQSPGKYAFQANVMDSSYRESPLWLGMFIVKGNPAEGLDKLSLDELYDIFNMSKHYDDKYDYICDWVAHNSYNATIYDNNGIPMLPYSGSEGQPSGSQYSPEYIARYSLLDLCDFLRTSEKSSFYKSIKYITWLMNNLKTKNNASFWTYDFALKTKQPYILEAGWPSALAQGFGLAVLGKAYSITKDPYYYQEALRVLKGFEVPVEKGGIRRDSGGGFWYEEYPTSRQSFVLNGFLVSLISLHDFYSNTNNERAKYFFEMGLKALKANLSEFEVVRDGVVWTAYDLADSGNTVLLRFLKKDPTPLLIHKISVFDRENKPLTSIKVGGLGDTDRGSSFIWFDPVHQKWGEPKSDQTGVTYRDANYYQKTEYEQAPFTILLPIGFEPLKIEIDYSNAGGEASIEVFDGIRYKACAIIAGSSATKQWGKVAFVIEGDMLSALRRNKTKAVDYRYHDANVYLLNQIYNITKDEVYSSIIRKALPALKLVPSSSRRTQKILLREAGAAILGSDRDILMRIWGEERNQGFVPVNDSAFICCPAVTQDKSNGKLMLLYIADEGAGQELRSLMSDNGIDWETQSKPLKNVNGAVSMDLITDDKGNHDSIYISDGKQVISYEIDGQELINMKKVISSNLIGCEYAITNIATTSISNYNICLYQSYDEDKYLATNIAFSPKSDLWFKLVSNPVFVDWNRIEEQYKLYKVFANNRFLYLYYKVSGKTVIKTIEIDELMKYIHMTEKLH